MPKPVSLTAAAAVFGIHRNTLAKWIREGCPYVTEADRGEGVDWELDTAAVHKWRVDTSIKSAVSSYVSADGRVTQEEADRRRAVAMAIIAEVEADGALKSVVSRFDVEAILADFCQALRSALSNVGAKIASRTATMNRPAEIQAFCQEAINKAYLAAQTDLQGKWSDQLGGELDEDKEESE